MDLLLIGGSGRLGSRILREAISRSHVVVAAVRKAESVQTSQLVSAVVADASDADAIATIAKGKHAVVSAISPWSAGGAEKYLAAVRGLIEGTRRAEGPRLFVSGGASSLFVGPGRRLLDEQLARGTDHQQELLSVAGAVYQAYELLQASNVAWTFVSPAGNLEPGARTGAYRIGGDGFPPGTGMDHTVSMEDFAAAMIDEVEQGAHVRQQISVA